MSATLDHERVGDVACLPPVRRSARDRVLVRMQASERRARPAAGARRRQPRSPAARGRHRPRHDRRQDVGPDRARGADGGPRSRARSAASPSSWSEPATRLDRARCAQPDETVRDGGLTEIDAGIRDGPCSGARAAGRGCRRETCPDRQSVRERRQRAQAGRRSSAASGAGRKRSSPRREGTQPSSPGLVDARRGDLRLLGRRHLQRGDQRHHRRLPLGFIPGGGTSVLPSALGLPRDPSRAAATDRLGHARDASHSAGSTAAGSRSTRDRVRRELVRRVDALGRREDGKRPGDVALRLDGRANAGRTGVALRAGARGRRDSAAPRSRSIANCSPYTYAGRLGLRFAPDAPSRAVLDVVAPIDVRARSIPRLTAQALSGRPGGPIVLDRRHDLDRIRDPVRHADFPARSTARTSATSRKRMIVAERDALTVLT